MKSRMIVAIDFDGTLVDHRYPDIGPIVPGAVEWCKRLLDMGVRLILWTMRDDGGDDGPVLTQAVNLLKIHGVEFWGINRNPEQGWSKSPKAYANYSVDDNHALCPLKENPRLGGRPYVDWSVIGPWLVEKAKAYEVLDAPEVEASSV